MTKNKQRTYIAIDLKSFYASVECRERNLDPLTTNLVVADISRTEKTICLAVSPSLKAYGIPGRARLFEVVAKVKEVNNHRAARAKGKDFEPLTYIVAPPRMALYMKYSTKVYQVYLKFVAPEDIHVYSVDEVFIDVTDYLFSYRMTARELAKKMILAVYEETGITATAGIGTNLYLCKVAMDIEAKHIPADEDGVRIAELDESSYRRRLWAHQPITDFWRVGKGTAKRLEVHGLLTMGDIARCSIGKPGEYHNEELLYKIFGINAELLIDHAWGYESCTIASIKAYKPKTNSLGVGQVLTCATTSEIGRLNVREMADQLVLDLVEKGLVAGQVDLVIGYDIENLSDPEIMKNYKGEIKKDWYGRKVPKSAHGAQILDPPTSSTKRIMDAFTEVYDRIVDPGLYVRRMYVTLNNVVREDDPALKERKSYQQMDLFTDYEAEAEKRSVDEKELARERKLQEAAIELKKRFGKNAVLKGMNLQEGATAIERNSMIGGHKA